VRELLASLGFVEGERVGGVWIPVRRSVRGRALRAATLLLCCVGAGVSVALWWSSEPEASPAPASPIPVQPSPELNLRMDRELRSARGA